MQECMSLFCSSSAGGQLVFVDAAEMSVMTKQEQPDLSEVEWDPTGRYVATSVNLWNAKVQRNGILR